MLFRGKCRFGDPVWRTAPRCFRYSVTPAFHSGHFYDLGGGFFATKFNTYDTCVQYLCDMEILLTSFNYKNTCFLYSSTECKYNSSPPWGFETETTSTCTVLALLKCTLHNIKHILSTFTVHFKELWLTHNLECRVVESTLRNNRFSPVANSQ